MWLTRPFCGHFAGSWTRYLNTVADADPVQVPLSLLFFEFSGPCVNAPQLTVYDADVLVRRGVDGTASDNRPMRVVLDLQGCLQRSTEGLFRAQGIRIGWLQPWRRLGRRLAR